MLAVVVRTYAPSQTSTLRQYLTQDARHLAVETAAGADLETTLQALARPSVSKSGNLVLAQIALSLAKNERGSPNDMFAAGRDVMSEIGVAERPWFAVLHGPPHDAHTHVHLVVRLDDERTGERPPLARVTRAAAEAAALIAPRYGWTVPQARERAGRWVPRTAQAYRVWHGEFSVYEWVSEIVGPDLRQRVDAATTPAEIGAVFAEYGLRYVRTERGALIEEWSTAARRAARGFGPVRIPASALAWNASGVAIEERVGAVPLFPPPADAEQNARAYANDERRFTDLATAEERRLYDAERATWRAVWLPANRARLDAQRSVENGRKSEVVANMRAARALRDAMANTPDERQAATAFLQEYERVARQHLHQQAKGERAALRAEPFAQPPPDRLKAWLRERNAPVIEPRTLRAPRSEREMSRPAAPMGLRLLAGLDGTAEWWTEQRRVAIDCGGEIVVCDPGMVDVAVQAAGQRWSELRVGGDQAFRDAVGTAARPKGVPVGFELRVVREVEAMPLVSAHAGMRRAGAIMDHVRARAALVDGRQLRREPGERSVYAGPAIELALAPVEALTIAVNRTTLARMESAGIVAAVVSADTATFVLDRSWTSNERAAILETLRATYGVVDVRAIPLSGQIRYGPTDLAPGLRRIVEARRPATQPPLFADRVRTLTAFFESMLPEQREATIAGPAPSKEEAPKRTRPRTRGGRSR